MKLGRSMKSCTCTCMDPQVLTPDTPKNKSKFKQDAKAHTDPKQLQAGPSVKAKILWSSAEICF